MIYVDTIAACDNCGSEAGSDCSKVETRKRIKELGWKRRKNEDGIYEDICPTCLHNEKLHAGKVAKI